MKFSKPWIAISATVVCLAGLYPIGSDALDKAANRIRADRDAKQAARFKADYKRCDMFFGDTIAHDTAAGYSCIESTRERHSREIQSESK